MHNNLFISIFTTFILWSCQSRGQELVFKTDAEITTGAERINEWLPDLLGKRVGVVGNNASRIGEKHLVDVLIASEVHLVKIFAPEHGFRGKASAGELIEDGLDPQSGLPVLSLYGKDKKPSQEALADVDVILFDLQDVGTRFYTYLSNLHYVMEACAENGVDLWVLDRPNPNGYYVDGPVLKEGFESFVGIHPIPVVHGCTLGELAGMIKGENWIPKADSLNLRVIKCKGYDHFTVYELPVKPSPNLPNSAAVYLYPSLCFFEGTTVSVGRGTNFPFQVYGAPWIKNQSFSFVPEDREGAMNPKHEGLECFGQNLRPFAERQSRNPQVINLSWLISAYESCPDQEQFFNPFFDKLAGTDALRKSIIEGKNSVEIRLDWKSEIDEYQFVRAKYLLY